MHPSAHPLQFHPVAPWLVAALLAGCGSLPSTTSTGSAGSSANPESSVTEVTGAPEAVFRKAAAGATACMQYAKWQVEAKYSAQSHSGTLTFSNPGADGLPVLATASLYEKSPGMTAMALTQNRTVAGRQAPFPFDTALPRWAFGDTSYCPIR